MVDELLCCINVRHDPVAEANSRSVECSLYGYGGWRSARPAPTRAATVKRHSSQAGFRIQGLPPKIIAWGYDAMGQVKTADRSGSATGDRGYTWDGIGNRYRSSKNGTDPDAATGTDLSIYRVATGGSSAVGANALNQYGRVEIDGTTGVDQTYDADGNQETGRYPSSGTGTRYWDGENRMYRTTVGSTDTNYAYDPFGRRVAKYQGSESTMTGRIYFYDGWNVAAECSIASTTYPLERTYTWGPDLSGSMQGAGGVGGLLAVEIETGGDAGVYYPTFDGNGNISEYLDSSALPVVVAHFEYDPFGDEVVASGSKFALFNYRFSTKPLDGETGYYYYGYRYFDPVTGRWPSRDPIAEDGGLNLYGFVGNNAINAADLRGMIFIITPQIGPAVPLIAPRPFLRILPRVGDNIIQFPRSPAPSLPQIRPNPISPPTPYVVPPSSPGTPSTSPGSDPSNVPQNKIDEQGVEDWINEPDSALEKQDRRKKSERCRKIYKKYKDAQDLYSKQPYGKTHCCWDLHRALIRTNHEISGRTQYLEEDCDEVPWGGNADHPGQLQAAKNRRKNIIDEIRRRGCFEKGKNQHEEFPDRPRPPAPKPSNLPPGWA